MNQDETIALFLQGKHAWNAWATGMLTRRRELEASGRWAVLGHATNLMADNEDTRIWISNAKADFSDVHFKTREPEAATTEPIPSGNARICEVACGGNSIDFNGFIFPGSALFGQAQFIGETEFVGAKFHRSAYFNSALFQADVWFFSTEFLDEVWFQEAQFANVAWFPAAQFRGKTVFNKTIFRQIAWFERVKFYDDAEFSGAQFYRDAKFEEAHFSRDARFVQVKFKGNVFFEDAHFQQKADFQLVAFPMFATFARARFDGVGDFNAIRGERAFDLAEARFKAVPDFIQAHFEEAPRLDHVKVTPRMLADYPDFVRRKNADGKDVVSSRRERARHTFWRWLSLPQRFAAGSYRRVTRADYNLTARWRSLKRLAIQAHDQDREHEFFAQEIRSARFVTDWPFPKPISEANGWIAFFRFLFGYAYGLLSNYGRSVLLPFLWWSAGVVVAASFYFGEHLDVMNSRPISRPWGEMPGPSLETNLLTAWRTGTEQPCFVTQSQIADEAVGPKTPTPKIEIVGLSSRLRDQTSASYEAFQLALRDGFLILYGDADTAHRTYGCLYGIELYGGGNPVAIVPPQVGFWSAIHKLYSAVMIFLFGLALRNMLKMK